MTQQDELFLSAYLSLCRPLFLWNCTWVQTTAHAWHRFFRPEAQCHCHGQWKVGSSSQESMLFWIQHLSQSTWSLTQFSPNFQVNPVHPFQWVPWLLCVPGCLMSAHLVDQRGQRCWSVCVWGLDLKVQPLLRYGHSVVCEDASWFCCFSQSHWSTTLTLVKLASFGYNSLYQQSPAVTVTLMVTLMNVDATFPYQVTLQ